VDAGHADRHVDHAVDGTVGEADDATDVGEAAADLGHHEVAADEGDLGVTGVDRPVAGDGDLGPVDDPGDGGALGDGHVLVPLSRRDGPAARPRASAPA
jgi:hypothetical protein